MAPKPAIPQRRKSLKDGSKLKNLFNEAKEGDVAAPDGAAGDGTGSDKPEAAAAAGSGLTKATTAAVAATAGSKIAIAKMLKK